MALVKRFEDFEAWQAGRQLAKSIYALTESERFRRDFGLIDQIRRASVSIMNNIVEGFDSGSPAEFIKFLGYARRSGSEVQSCLYVAVDRGHVEQAEFHRAYDEAERARNLIGGFIRYLRTQRMHKSAALHARHVGT